MRGKLEQFGQKFIFIILGIWLSTEVLFSSNIEYIFKWKKEVANDFMAVAILVLLLIQITILQRYTFYEIIMIGLISIPIILGTINSNNKLMMSTWVFVIASKYLDLNKTIKIAYFSQLLMMAVVIYLYLTNSIDETTLYRGNLLRHSLGFAHPNLLGIRVFQCVLCHCYLRRNRMNFADFFLIGVSAYMVKQVADSKTSYYALLILIGFLILHRIFEVFDGIKTFSKVMIYTFIISNTFSIFFSMLDIRCIPFLKNVDEVMSRRFSHCHRTYEFYGIKLFGQDVQSLVSRHEIGKIYRFWLDNAYMAILLRYGMVVFIVFSVLYLCTMIYLKNTEQYMLLEILALFAIYGIMENNFFSMSQNIFLIALSFPLYCRDSSIKEKHRRVRIIWQ